MNKIKCWFGFHNWFNPIPSERICIRCGKHQARVIYYGGFIAIMYFHFKKEEYWASRTNPYLKDLFKNENDKN